MDLVARTTRDGRVEGFEIEIHGPSPRRIEANSAVVLDSQGAQQGMILVFHDVTRLHQLENTRREFVANVSHELRTPLSLIKGFTETLLDGAMNDPAVATKFLRTVEKQSNRLTFLIEDLLTISRLESGTDQFQLQPVDLHATAQRVIDDLQNRASESKVTLKNEIPHDLRANADAPRLQQVFSNLIENAIKYGASGAAVVVSATANAEGMIECSVRDFGAGIPAESLPRVFERFYRVDKGRSREKGGTGLGLAIVKHIVQGHGGTAWATSELGKGADFHFTLPAVPTATATRREEEAKI